ncbi:WD40-repeat-containing domain protein, partial [Scleroderma yunnanense]
MSRYPHTGLFNGPVHSTVITGAYIQVLDTSSGAILCSTANFTADDHDVVIKSGPIRCVAISQGRNHIATSGDDKHLRIWDLASLAPLSSRELPKKPTAIQFTKNNDILVADKFGDVFRYPLHPDLEAMSKEPKNDALVSHKNLSGSELVLGHASVLTCCLLTPDEDFIITSDRDEHIRVSWYPEGYVIEAYCLGHEKYVSAIHIPSFASGSLISGGGDPVLKVWDWMTGRLQRNIYVFEAVEPFVMVKAQQRRHKSQEDGDDGDDMEGNSGRGRQKKKGKAKQGTPSNDTEDPSNTAASAMQDAVETETVIVVRKISSLVSDSGNHIVFSIVGATALFAFILGEGSEPSPICHFDCESPVIDFTVADDGSIWILLDAEYVGNMSARTEIRLVRVVRWLRDQFVEVESTPLLESLNTTCTIPATPAALKTLDLYSDLMSLPKHTGEEPRSQGREHSELPEGIHGAFGEGTSAVDQKSLPKRTAGRLKHKLALQRLQQEKTDNADSEAPGIKRPRAETGEEADAQDTPMDET